LSISGIKSYELFFAPRRKGAMFGIFSHPRK